GGALLVGDIRYTRNRLGTYQHSELHNFSQDLSEDYIDRSKTGQSDTVKTNPFGAVPSMFIAVPVLKDRLTIGGGVYVPNAAILNLPTDGAQRWQVQQATILITNVTASLGVRINDYFSFGGGISYVLGFAELSKVQDFGSVPLLADAISEPPISQENDLGDDAPTEVRELDSLSRPLSLKRAFSHGVTFNVGAAIKPTKKFGLNLVYQHSSAMKFNGDFSLLMDDPFFTEKLAGVELPDGRVAFKPLIQGSAVLRFKTPKRITLGLAYDINEKLRIDGFVMYSFYRELKAFDVEVSSPDLAQPALGIPDSTSLALARNWNDTVAVEMSGRLRLTDRLLSSVTLGYQSPASPDSTIDLASPDGHRPLGGVGMAFDVNKKWRLQADARLQGIIPRTVTESDYDLGNGTYKLFLATFGLHAQARF
ncbi:MAG: OmpP1/FadL family transporter, partial [Nannocystaceae bacterium]